MPVVAGLQHWGIYEFPLVALREMPTIEATQFADLKMESDRERVWLSRMTREDGQSWDNMVEVERLIAGEWIIVERWEAV